jgi:hypothetical protein
MPRMSPGIDSRVSREQGVTDKIVVPFAALTRNHLNLPGPTWHVSCDIGRRGAACFETVLP